MKTESFEIKCSECGSENVRIWEWHNKDGEGIKLVCNDCKVEEKL